MFSGRRPGSDKHFAAEICYILNYAPEAPETETLRPKAAFLSRPSAGVIILTNHYGTPRDSMEHCSMQFQLR